MKKLLFLILTFVVIFSFELYSQTTMWAEAISGEGANITRSVVVDADGNTYVSGYFNSTTLSFNNGWELENTGIDAPYIAKYNSLGVCQWARKITGDLDPDFSYGMGDYIVEMVLGNDGYLYVTGTFISDNLYFEDDIQLSRTGYQDAFYAKFNSSGECLWANSISGNDEAEPQDITMDSNGDIYIAGNFFSDVLYFNNGIELTKTEALDGFFAKFDNSGECQWAKAITGGVFNDLIGIGVDGSGGIYITGKTTVGEVYFDEENSLVLDGLVSYLVKYNSNVQFQWAKLLNSEYTDVDAKRIAFDASDNVYIVGNVKEDGGTARVPGYNFSSFGATDLGPFILKYNSTGNLQWMEQITGNNKDFADAIYIGSTGDVYISGNFSSSELNFNNDISLEKDGEVDSYNGYFAKYNSSGECQWAERITGDNSSGEIGVYGIAVDANQNVYVGGFFKSDEVLFNNDITLEQVGEKDGFLAKYRQPIPASKPIVSDAIKTSGVTSSAAISGGEVISDGGAEVSERGVCISESRYPDVDDIKILADEAGVGSFTVKIEDLKSATKYYVRVFATNSAGTSYGKERTFTTAP